jgi:hypothetical protein
MINSFFSNIKSSINFTTSLNIISNIFKYKTKSSNQYSSNVKNTYGNTVKYNINMFYNLWSLHKVSYLTLHLASAGRWIKIRASYLINSWVYTTNHKRIAINYFNFVLVAGTAGMSLASVIRMEFAYPGVGILAGDSIQYLCIATAHGVIMVFFMIMPAIFGAFGNFLLPTQLGVHDVAFPRLNSAAFWFLPGGLIMLCQLVCVDRRYQRMNCFNIRELQGILKRKFFTDLVNTSDSRSAIDATIIGMRHKNNMSNILLYDQHLFYNFDITTTSKYKSFFISPGEIYSYSSSKLVNFSKFFNFIPSTKYINGLQQPTIVLNQTIKDFFFFIYTPIGFSVLTIVHSFNYVKSVFTSTFNLVLPNITNLGGYTYINTKTNLLDNTVDNFSNKEVYNYISSTTGYNNLSNTLKSSYADNSSS